jgi:hypothetical protein
MTAKRVSTRLAFSLVLAAAMASLAMGETRQVRSTPVWYQVWTPNLYGLNMYNYLGPIAPYAPGFFPLDGYYGYYYNPMPSPFGTIGSYYPYTPYVYPPPFYGGYYTPNTNQWWYYRWYNRPGNGPGYNYRGLRPGRSSPQAPTQVPRSR